MQSLGTTATWNDKEKHFIIDQPDISAAKYWPGDLGLASNHALLYAKLIVKGKSHGVHPFFI